MLVFGLITGAISVLCFALLIGIRIGRHLEANGIVKTSPNTGSPKLPTLEECQKVVQSHIRSDIFVGTSVNVTECVYNFISRQLSGRA